MEAKCGQEKPFINRIREEMKNLIVDLINKEIQGLIGINALSVVIYATKVVQGVRLSHSYKAILGVCILITSFVFPE